MMIVWRIRGKIPELFYVVLCTTVLHSDMHTRQRFLKMNVGLDLGLVFCVRFFCYSLDHFVLVLFAFVVLGLFYSVQNQEIGWENISKMTYFVSIGT